MTALSLDPDNSEMLDLRQQASEASVAWPAVLLTAGVGVVSFLQLLVSFLGRADSAIWIAWPKLVLALHAVGAIVVIAFTLRAVFGLVRRRFPPSLPIARLVWYSTLVSLLGVVCAWGGGGENPAHGPGFYWLWRGLRLVLAIGLPQVLIKYITRSKAAVAAYGRGTGEQIGDHLMTTMARDGALAIPGMIALLLMVLATSSIPSMKTFGLSFLWTSEWRANELPGKPILDERGKPIIEDGELLKGPPTPPAFGALPVIYGTAMSSLIALIVAVPLSFGAALFLVRVAPDLPPISIKAGVCGLLIVLLIPMGVGRGLAAIGMKSNLLTIAISVIAGIAVAEVMIWLVREMLGRATAPQVDLTAPATATNPGGRPRLDYQAPSLKKVSDGRTAPVGWTILIHAVLLLLGGIFGWMYLGLGGRGAMLLGLVLSGGMFFVASYFTPAVSFLIEFLAAIPSIAYGLWGMHILMKFLQTDLEPMLRSTLNLFRLDVQTPLTGRDLLNGGLVLGIMIIPIITAISRDVLQRVPRGQIEGTAALGATWWQSSREMLKFGRSALFGAVMLGLARAAGETMAVTMVIGNNPQITGLSDTGWVARWLPNPFAPSQTMASLLANEFGEADKGTLHYSALMYVAFALLVMSLLFNVIARYFVVGKGARTAAAH